MHLSKKPLELSLMNHWAWMARQLRFPFWLMCIYTYMHPYPRFSAACLPKFHINTQYIPQHERTSNVLLCIGAAWLNHAALPHERDEKNVFMFLFISTQKGHLNVSIFPAKRQAETGLQCIQHSREEARCKWQYPHKSCSTGGTPGL